MTITLAVQVRMDGSDGRTDMRMSVPNNVGAFYRESTKPDGSALCLGQDIAATNKLTACVHAYSVHAMSCCSNHAV